MSGEGKYAKYVIQKTVDPPADPLPGAPRSVGGRNVLLINNEHQGAVPNATYLNAEVVSKPTEPGPFEQHAHSFDEYVTFIGTNIEKPYDLDGVVRDLDRRREIHSDPEILLSSSQRASTMARSCFTK